MKVTCQDFYCGAFLSILLNNNISPTLFDNQKDLNRRIYDFTTDNGDYRVYVKHTVNNVNDNDENPRWNFVFTKAQIDEIQRLHTEKKILRFVFVCGREKLQDSIIAVLSKEDLLDCIEVTREDRYKKQTISIMLPKGRRNFEVYGTNKVPLNQ